MFCLYFVATGKIPVGEVVAYMYSKSGYPCSMLWSCSIWLLLHSKPRFQATTPRYDQEPRCVFLSHRKKIVSDKAVVGPQYESWPLPSHHSLATILLPTRRRCHLPRTPKTCPSRPGRRHHRPTCIHGVGSRGFEPDRRRGAGRKPSRPAPNDTGRFF